MAKDGKQAENEGLKKDRKKSKQKLMHAGLVGAVILLVGVILAESIYNEKHYVPYSEFLKQLEAGQVERVVDCESSLNYHLTGDRATYNTESPETDDFKERLLLAGIKVSKGLGTDELLSLASIVIMLALGLVFVRFFTSTNGDSERYLVTKSTDVTFQDVVGLEDIKKELEVTVDILKNSDRYKEQGVRIPKGIVLEGEPGNGKTLLAKAIAGESGLNFLSANASDFGGIIVGKGSNQVKKLFREARKNKPCIIFIDEFDSVAEKRHTDGTAASTDDSKTLTAFLNELDGFRGNNDGVFLIVATNRPEVIDEALIRPGRFDKRYYVTNPTYDERLELIAMYTKNKQMAQDVDPGSLAWEFTGYSCSMIEMLINEAAILSVNRGKEKIDRQDVEDSVSKYILRGGKSSVRMTGEKRKIVAVHEAGHAVAGALLAQEKISKISIAPSKSGMGGYTIAYDEDELYLPSIDELERKVMMLYAGRAAEFVFCGEENSQVTTGASNDIDVATQYIIDIANLGKSEALLELSRFGDCGTDGVLEDSKEIAGRLWNETVSFVRDNWEAILGLQGELLEHETIDRDRFEAVMSRYYEENSLEDSDK